MNLGLLIIAITLIGSVSNWINWKYLNYPIVRLLYYLGAVVHELSHAFFCVLTGARIEEISIFSKQPHVTHYKSKIPFLGSFLISVAPIIGGLLFLFLINRFYLENYIAIPQFYDNWQSFLLVPFKILSQLNILSWKSWVVIFLSLNVGAMIGPSWQDLKNIWFIIIILLFFQFSSLNYFTLLIIFLIPTNIIIQISLVIIIKFFKIISDF